MTGQNVVFLAALAAAGLGILFHLNFLLTHMPWTLGGLALVLGALWYVTREGLVDWDEWIPKGRE